MRNRLSDCLEDVRDESSSLEAAAQDGESVRARLIIEQVIEGLEASGNWRPAMESRGRRFSAEKRRRAGRRGFRFRRCRRRRKSWPEDGSARWRAGLRDGGT